MMVSLAELFEAVTFFGEIVIGQIGFQVIAISLGRRGLGAVSYTHLTLPTKRIV